MLGKARRIAARLHALGSLGIVFLCLAVPAGALGEEPSLSPAVHEQLVAVQELIQNEQHEKALGHIQALARDSTMSPYETAFVQQTLGYVHAGLEQYEQAVRAFQTSLAGGALPPDTLQTVRYNLAQMLMSAERYEEGARTLENWLANEANPRPQALVSLAQAYIQIKRYARAEQSIQRAIEATTTFHEAWYQMLIVIQVEQEKFSQAAVILQRLLGRYPQKKIYWQQLSQLYSQEDKHHRAAATLATAYKFGLLDEQEAIQVVQYYLHLGLPYKAAELLLDGLKKEIVQDGEANRELLVTCWLHARENQRALDVLERLAERAQTGKIDLRRAEILAQLERWREVVASVSEGLRKGGLTDEGTAFMLLGIAEYRSGHLDDSKAAFTKATAHSASARQARQWLRLVEQDMTKQER